MESPSVCPHECLNVGVSFNPVPLRPIYGKNSRAPRNNKPEMEKGIAPGQPSILSCQGRATNVTRLWLAPWEQGVNILGIVTIGPRMKAPASKNTPEGGDLLLGERR